MTRFLETAIRRLTRSLGASLLAVLLAAGGAAARAEVPPGAQYHDSHFHLTNYIQEGTDIRDYLAIMGDRVGRSTVFGIPLQQMWSHGNSGDFAPTYYLHSDAPLYYYSFTDAYIAMAYRSLAPEQQARFDPMITGFNPADMYGVDHIKRVLRTFPGVFSGIGEFSIHKEFVSSKVAGDVASLTNPALDRILEFAGEAGLVVILHNDLDMPFAKENAEPVYLEQMRALLRRHPNTKIIWAHVGLGRVVHPVQTQAAAGAAERSATQLEIVEGILSDPSLAHVHFDISWREVAKYAVASEQSQRNTASLLNKYPDRVLFGTDEVGAPSAEQYFQVYEMYQPLWDALTPEARHAVLKGNYERLFDEARVKVRAWERANAKK
jgi:predicted TIM-barrel fold metal-dependent hydrolase